MSYGRGPPDIHGMFSLKVDNLTYRTTPEDLRRAFEKYGDVGDVYIPRDRFSRESRGFAFVRFYDRRDAEDAMDALDGAVMDGRELRCQLAKYGRPSESSSSSHRDGRGGDRGAPPRRRRRSFSRSRSRSKSRDRRRRHSPSRSRSRSRSYNRSRSRSHSKSASRSPAAQNNHAAASKSRSRSRSRSRSPREYRD